jgi:hypothetical protein
MEKKSIYFLVAFLFLCLVGYSAFGVFMGFDLGHGHTVVFWGGVGASALLMAVGFCIAAVRQEEPSTKELENAIAEKEEKYLKGTDRS